MNTTMFHVLTNLQTNASRRILFEGREHIAAPVVILVEGVHRGSGGPLFYPASALEASASFWNGMPVPVQHPELNGTPISCNSPDVIEKQTVGRLWNVVFESTPKPRLKGEIYVDIDKTRKISPAALDALCSNQPLEVSTGLFTSDEYVNGVWNGEGYTAVVKDIRPDHLALLPGAIGACSWADGCGVRANKELGEPDMGGENVVSRVVSKISSAFQSLLGNELSLDGKLSKIRAAVYALDGPTRDCRIEEVFEDNVVYEVCPGPQSMPGTPSLLCRRKYTIEEDGTVVLDGEIEIVRKEISYAVVANEEPKSVSNGPSNNESVQTKTTTDPKVAAAMRAATIHANRKTSS